MFNFKVIFFIVASLSMVSCATPLTPEQALEKSKADEKKLEIHTKRLIHYCAVISAAKKYMDKNKEDVSGFSENQECLYYAKNATLKGYKSAEKRSTPRISIFGLNISNLIDLKKNMQATSNLMTALNADIPEHVVKMGKNAVILYQKIYVHGLSEASMLYVSKTKKFKKLVHLYQ